MQVGCYRLLESFWISDSTSNYVLKVYCVSYSMLTTFTYPSIFKGLIFFSLLVFISKKFFPFQLLFCCFYCIALAILPPVWHYLILKIVSFRLPPFCFCPQELSRLNHFALGHLLPTPILILAFLIFQKLRHGHIPTWFMMLL